MHSGALEQSDVIHKLQVERLRGLGFKQEISGEEAWWWSREMYCHRGHSDEGRRTAYKRECRENVSEVRGNVCACVLALSPNDPCYSCYHNVRPLASKYTHG